MTTLAEVYLEVRNLLEGLPGLQGRVWLSEADPEQELDHQNRVHPYVVLGFRIPEGVNDPNLVDLNTLDARTYRFQTQLVAPSHERLLAMTDYVLTVLHEYPVGTGVLRSVPEDSPSEPILDTTVTPKRPFMPLYWVLRTQ